MGLTNGQISVLYSAATSINGAKLLANKGPARKVTIEDMSDALAAPTILTPHALPMFRDGEDGMARGTKRRREKERADPRKSRRPEMPVTGPGRGGRVGASATQHVVQNLVRDTTRDEDVSATFVFCSYAFRWKAWLRAPGLGRAVLGPLSRYRGFKRDELVRGRCELVGRRSCAW